MPKKDNNAGYFHSVGRRKEAVARIWLKAGDGKIEVNGRSAQDYFPTKLCFDKVNLPAKLTETTEKISVKVNVQGGGFNGQADAVKLGIARALTMMNAEFRSVLKKQGLLRVDARIKERKKPGQKGARAKFQFVKR